MNNPLLELYVRLLAVALQKQREIVRLQVESIRLRDEILAEREATIRAQAKTIAALRAREGVS